ncbi:xylose isomerase-like TIM barrel protein [Isoptericola sp. CG 20/1183]|uniref:Xylose isomerase-like TIM barrel protein n=1 Tax=Isoptericola halotolerans TaxID=300560 RepID=A0ABX5EKC2_9MICO|nr:MULTISPECIES: metabolite traffic protein EboE [Isoptericola]PRZ02495.1 xylose isomerase-like TIM barrel protein [Isoptericola sp. CG 20/1183]PRZ04216.1 xylose isomerase-like TIM barrel protein [Isoptericola sp. CG 20/1183]PRZ09959.1 xylose isomerase-like TIM barrel protein [Isoptericola halotolerans]
MRLRHPDGTVLHVSYGTNVHPAQDVDGLVEQVRRFAGPVRRRLGVDRLGLGLWLPAEATRRLATDPAAVGLLRKALDREGLEVVTVNAFPYGNFHAPVVKKAVYRPDWTEDDRLHYTLDCAQVLGELLPDDVARGSISTLPLGWREPWDAARARAARERVDRLAEGLGALEDRTGRTVRVAFEPEPGCVAETTEGLAEHLDGVDTERLGACVDLCHLATEFEDPAEALANLHGAGLAVVKTQVSAALHCDDPTDPEALAALEEFVEARFLHQVREQRDASVQRRDDLPDALGRTGPADALPGEGPWRVHVHVPLHADPRPPLRSTRDVLTDALGLLVGGAHPLVDHLETETYTWSVLPAHLRPRDDDGLVAGIAAELDWTRARLVDRGMEVL